MAGTYLRALQVRERMRIRLTSIDLLAGDLGSCQTAVSGPLAEMGRWLEDQGLSADALVPLHPAWYGAGPEPDQHIAAVPAG